MRPLPHTFNQATTRLTPITSYPRIVIDSVMPSLGQYPARLTLDEPILIKCVAFCDDHDVVDCRVLIRHEKDKYYKEFSMASPGNDEYQLRFEANLLGRYFFYIQADINRLRTCMLRIHRCTEDADALASEWMHLEHHFESMGPGNFSKKESRIYDSLSLIIKQRSLVLLKALENEDLARLWFSTDSPTRISSPQIFELIVEAPKARFSTWYEFFPRSTSPVRGAHGTFKDCGPMLERVAKMGFDTVYLPPIHPIGHTHRKGKNNATNAATGDVGSPWAIGNQDGGHKSIHPSLGTLSDFHDFVSQAKSLKMDVALDLAFQCSPDHPYLKDHPEWFQKNLDGSFAYAVNPPKKYQDIYPFDFHCQQWPALYHELKSIVSYWIEQGIHIFRVDNPHTKPFHFWQWLINEVRLEHPNTIFLSEAFTRPKVAFHLAKIGFSQSYTYFTWRHTKNELTELMREYTCEPNRYFFRPNLWPNTPDILGIDLQNADRSVFIQRFVLAATLSSSYGIYGPVFETLASTPKEIGSEEYKDSEKYELKHHSHRYEETISPVIQHINQIRRDNKALQYNHHLEFIETHNEKIIAYIKTSPVDDNVILTLVNLDAHETQEARIDLKTNDIHLQDLISGQRISLIKGQGTIHIDPLKMPASIFRVHHKLRSEKDFDYFG